jgi:hypothetical protein
MTAQEDTPPDSAEAVEPEAETASRGHTRPVDEVRLVETVVVARDDVNPSPLPRMNTAETGSASRPLSRARAPKNNLRLPLLAAAVLLPVAAVVAVVLVLTSAEPEPPRRPVVVVDDLPRPPVGPPPVAPAAPAPDVPPAPVVVDAGAPDVVEPPPAPPPRSTTPVKKKKVERPKLLGDRIRALKACDPRPLCATAVLKHAADVTSLSVDELKDLDGEVDRCLDRCR